MAFLYFMQALLNGKWIEGTAPSVAVDDRGFRYGAGIFETIRFEKDAAPLWDRHMSRLLDTLAFLQWQLPAHFSTEKLLEETIRTIRKNKILGSVRVRITFTHGTGGYFDGDRKLNILIEAWPLDPARKEFNTNGWVLGLFDQARKAADRLACCKSTSALLYTQAAQYAKSQKWNDALVLNTSGNIADSCIANVFVLKGDELYTTDAVQGAVEGVMQSWWIDRLASYMPVRRGVISPDILQEADEVFLTNALFGIRWVGRIGEREYGHTVSHRLFQEHLRTIFR